MTCSACCASVEAALDAVPGVVNAVVSLIQQQARVEYVSAAVTPVSFAILLENTDFDAPRPLLSRAAGVRFNPHQSSDE